MTGARQRQEPPRWWEFPWREIGAFFLGAGVLFWQTVFEDHAQPVLVGAALALVGFTSTGTIQRMVRRWLSES